MTPFDRILVVLHPSLRQTPAVDRAVALARATGAKLWLGLFDAGMTVPWYATPGRANRSHLETLLSSDVTARLDLLCKRVQEATGADVEVIDDRHRPDASRITGFVERHRITLIIKDVGHASPMRRLVFVPLDWELLRTSAVPVWLTGRTDSALPRSVAAAVDPAHAVHGAGRVNDKILSTAKTLGAVSQAPLKVLTCFTGLSFQPTMDPTGLGVGWRAGDLYAQLRSDHKMALDDLLEKHALAFRDGILLHGAPGETLLAAVRQNAVDLLVVGSIRRHGVDRLLMGSTAEFLVSRAPCDILAVPVEVDPAAAEARTTRDVIVV